MTLLRKLVWFGQIIFRLVCQTFLLMRNIYIPNSKLYSNDYLLNSLCFKLYQLYIYRVLAVPKYYETIFHTRLHILWLWQLVVVQRTELRARK